MGGKKRISEKNKIMECAWMIVPPCAGDPGYLGTVVDDGVPHDDQGEPTPHRENTTYK